MRLRPYAKAVTAFVTTACGTLAVALADGSVSPVEWCGIVSGTVAATAAVFGIRNTPA